MRGHKFKYIILSQHHIVQNICISRYNTVLHIKLCYDLELQHASRYAECAIIRMLRDGGDDENKLRNFLHPPTNASKYYNSVICTM